MLILASVVALEHLLQHLVIQVLQLDYLLLLLPPGRRRRRRRPTHVVVRLAGEVEHGEVAAHGVGRTVVCPRRLLGSVERAEPDARALSAGVADLRRELAGGAAAHAAVLGVLAQIIVHLRDQLFERVSSGIYVWLLGCAVLLAVRGALFYTSAQGVA
jgi:hypothetical protein